MGLTMEKVRVLLSLIFIIGQESCSGLPLESLLEGNSPGRIVGGVDAALGEFPWQVSLQRPQFGDPIREKYCGGVVLNRRTVLTAGHCVLTESGTVMPASSLTIVSGIIDIQNPDGTQQEVVASRIRLHERFNWDTLENDVAVVTLSRDLTFDPNTSAIPIAPTGTVPTGVCIAVGWGETEEVLGYPDKLQKVDLDMVDRRTCESLWGVDNIKPGMICANRPYKGTCHADSGSGFVCRNAGGGYYLAGVVSWGQTDPCAEYPELPSVFTNVAEYATWIGPI